ncbi:hypothetical protein CBS63078_311 [Aspergillus niger]|nr:hypothetical protein CBS115989_8860 [Aspergillus niger]KAI2825250.1 hypothetical protein CBS133816_8644 [Aspergillus niger]KAI2836324.1 hypothetical protein CBS11350_9451 [Aspergillus niger]KAI2843226.1 hypothetical protein CBS11232_8339 [Aspergillus niger]KAI2859702.1 hypothetical protein CBS12448_5542 [Aspergillus niger]
MCKVSNQRYKKTLDARRNKIIPRIIQLCILTLFTTLHTRSINFTSLDETNTHPKSIKMAGAHQACPSCGAAIPGETKTCGSCGKTCPV